MLEMNDNSSVGVGTGALPLQNPRFFENEIALCSEQRSTHCLIDF